MWFTRLSIQRPVFVVVFMLTILVLGFRSLTSINVDLNPSINFPVVSILTTYPGTSSEEMETTVSKPIEDAVSSITGIQHINSTSQYGQSNVTIQFYLGVDANQAESDVREKVDAAKGGLPRDINPPVVSRFDFSDQPVLTVGMRTGMSLKQARFEAQKIIEPLVSQVSGVARVDVIGGDVREIQVNADRAKLAAYGLSIVDLVNAIQASNMNVAAGHITEGRFDFDARVLGELTSVDQLRNLRLPVPSKDPNKPLWIRLSDLATVDDTVAERSNISRIWDRAGDNHNAPLKGSESVSIVVTKSNDANTAQVADGAKAVLARLEKTLPGHTHFVINVDQSTLVKDQLKDIVVALVAGALLAVLVVFLFLHDIRGTLICATAIPISLIATFIPMYFAGFTLNSMTMMALSLVVGILVDDSIVVLENVFRHLQRGEQPSEAAYNGRSEIGLAAITITFVDVAVFLPMAWMGGIVGQFFRQFGLTVACATLFSLLVSFSVTPMLASRLYRSSADVEHQVGSVAAVFERFYQSLDRGYHGLIARVLRHRALVVIASVVLLFGVLFVFGPKLGFQFTPVTDQGQIVVTAELPAGTALEATDALVRVIEQRMSTIPEVESMFTSIGSLSGGTSSTPALGPQYAQVQLKLYDKPSALASLNPFDHTFARHRSDQEIAAQMRKLVATIPGARIKVVPVTGFGGAAAPVDIQLLGFDLKHMERIGDQMKAALKSVPGVMDPDMSLRPGKPEAEVIVDRAKAASFGYSVSQIGNVVRDAFAGDTTAKYRDKGDEFDIRVQFQQLDRSSIDQIGNIIVGTRGGYGSYQPVFLRDVASIQLGYGPTEIDRVDRQRVVHVTAYLAPGAALFNMQRPINAAIAKIPLGNVQMIWGGQAQSGSQEFGYLFATLGLSIVLVYLLMAALFDNLLAPFIIQVSMPMALVGAVVALVITHKTLSIITMIGVIMLVGLVQKNAILLVDYANTLRARGVPRNDAIQQAGAHRLRPILMTTVAMVFGMMPLAVGIGTSSESRSPLAICVIGGLIFSTVLTLLLIPVVYTLMDDLVAFIIRPFRRNGDARRTRVHNRPAEPLP